MKNKHTNILVLLLILASCASPKISNLERGRYKYATAPKNCLDVTVSILPTSTEESVQAKPVTFLDMRDSLPHLYMKLLSSKISNADTFISRLSKPIIPIAKVSTQNKQTDFTYYKVQFVFNNLKKYYNDERLMHPNTRLEFLTTYLALPKESAVTFYNINKLQNEFEEIDFGTLSRDQTVSLNSKLSASGGLGESYETNSGNQTTNTSNVDIGKEKKAYDSDGNVIGVVNRKGGLTSLDESTYSKKATAEAKVNGALDGSYQNSETIKEAIAVKLKRLKTGFNFSERELVIAQRGRAAGDISDNIYVTATLKVDNQRNVLPLPVYSFEKLYDENKQLNIADKLLFSRREVNFVPCDGAKDLTLTTCYEGAIRAVRNVWLKTGSNALEYDDRVTYYKIDEEEGRYLKIDKNVYCKNAYKFIADVSGVEYTLKIADPIPRELDIFIDDSPELFRQWIIDNLEKPVASNLNTTRFSLYFEKNETPRVQIPFVKQNMTPANIIALSAINGIKIVERNP
ncbi:hypothetical protein VB264_21125 [Arcicella aquatica]|uniref:Lipoprotein n=1 Tax=Arcicella aquatica TaxID=217141 RepID=A0ABU5QTY6_9BACT|nr:hypothetical protein [Arcicella aquatica]MEA5260315.1 hypothetical protein [Arcicella aquatica]